MGASFWNCIWERHVRGERQQCLHGELSVRRVTTGGGETGSFIIDHINDFSIWGVLQGLQISSQHFKANTQCLLRKKQLPQNVKPAHHSVSAQASRAGPSVVQVSAPTWATWQSQLSVRALSWPLASEWWQNKQIRSNSLCDSVACPYIFGRCALNGSFMLQYVNHVICLDYGKGRC